MNKSIFISKNLNELASVSSEFKKKEYDIVAHSFLSFAPTSFTLDQPFDVVFFGSPRAVYYFFKTATISSGIQIACVGESTAMELKKLGYSPNYIGEKSGDVSLLADSFKSWCHNKKVLFPVSDISLGTVAKQFRDDQKIEVIVYKTTITSNIIPSCDCYVMTSPSNVRGFLIENKFPDNAQIFAWGMSTAKELSNHNIKPNFILESATFEELIYYI